jgi:hypothetical protein
LVKAAQTGKDEEKAMKKYLVPIIVFVAIIGLLGYLLASSWQNKVDYPLG